MIKLLFLIASFSPLASFAQGKGKIDSVVIEFLKVQPNIPPPILTITGTKKKGTISRNYFLEKNKVVTKDSLKITTYKFGSGASHSRSYFLINIMNGKNEQYHIINNTKVEDGIKDLLNLVEQFSLSDSQKALLLNQLTVAYY